MTTRDIYNYVSFKEELEHLINTYIEKGIPATIILPIIADAYNSINAASKEEVKSAVAEVEKEMTEACSENTEADNG